MFKAVQARDKTCALHMLLCVNLLGQQWEANALCDFSVCQRLAFQGCAGAVPGRQGKQRLPQHVDHYDAARPAHTRRCTAASGSSAGSAGPAPYLPACRNTLLDTPRWLELELICTIAVTVLRSVCCLHLYNMAGTCFQV